MTLASMEAVPAVVSRSASPAPDVNTLPLERVPCIHYPVQFRKDQAKVQTLIDSGSEVNAMTPAYASKLGLKV